MAKAEPITGDESPGTAKSIGYWKYSILEYTVDQRGAVQELKEPEQLELKGLPKEKIKIEEEPAMLEIEAVDQFILNDMAPSYEDMPENIAQIVKRRVEGEFYSKLASELEMSG